VLLRQKAGETLDLELKGVQELPKLPEYTPESGATDFQDYLYLTEQQVGSLASGAAEWWQQTLGVAQTAYAEYQSLSPMKRLSVKATLTPELKADKYKKLERKVASLVLSSLPKGVRDELIAHRVQGLHQILFRLMVVFQPGGAQDRAQLLRQLDVSESSTGPAEAVVAIRRWYRLLQRAADLNIALPDESLQVRSLCNIVKKTAEQFGDFKFRVSLAKTELQIDSRPSQANVLRFLQHLLAELEQLGGLARKATAATKGYGSGAGNYIYSPSGNSALSREGTNNKIDAAKMTEILNETNKMLKARLSSTSVAIGEPGDRGDQIKTVAEPFLEEENPRLSSQWDSWCDCWGARGNCPVLPISQAMTLIAELEQARIKEFEATIEDLKKQVKVIRERGREEWSKRKSLLQSDNWVVHLCSGDGRTWDAKEQGSMRRAFWNSSLNGDEVLVEVDLTMSRSMDLLQQKAVFQVLSWAALSGKIKSVVGGPPRHTFPGEAKEASLPPQKLKETKLLVRMLMLWYMAQEGRVTAWHVGALRQPPIKPHVGLLVEHPDSCGDLRSFFDQPMWKVFAEEEMMGEVRCHMNGRPTVLGGNLDLWHLEGASVGALDAKDPAGSVWPMELVAHVAGALRSWKGLRSREGVLSSLVRRVDYEGGEVAPSLAKFNADEWRLHLQRDHLPYRLVLVATSTLWWDAIGFQSWRVFQPPRIATHPKRRLFPQTIEEDWLLDDPERGRDEEPAAGGVGEVIFDDVVRDEGKVIEEETPLDKEVEALKAWAAARDIEVTRTQGSDPAGNGTAERAVGAIKAVAFGRKLPTVARFGSRVFTKRKGYGQGGHLVFTDEGNLWFTTNVRQFEEPPREDEGALADVEDALEEDVTLEAFEVSSGSTTGSARLGPRGDLAAECLAERRFSMNDCLEVLQNENYRRTKKQRASAWKDNAPPPVHTTLGAYQRGPWSGVTTATTRHRSLAAYLVAMFKHHCGQDVSFTSMTVARDLCTDAHRDRFNLRTSKNYVLTVGNFEGGGIWQEGERDDLPAVSVQNGPDVAVRGFVSQVRNRVVEVDPKKLHKTMPWEGGPKWTVIAHTVGQHHKLTQEHRDELQALGFNLPTSSDLRKVSAQEECNTTTSLLQGPGWFPRGSDDDEEMWKRMWARRLLDEEESLLSMLGKDEAEDFEGVVDANKMLAKDLDAREADLCRDRYDAEQWLLLCRLAEGENEVRGVEPLLETLSAPLKVVFTVALDEVKQYVTRWVDAIHKEAEALIKAKALVPLTLEEQKELEASGRLVVLPAKGVFTVKPPDQEKLKDDSGRDLPPGSPEFFKRKARLVICGNFQGKQAKEDSYAGGCQTDSLRVMLVHAAAYGWMVASTDIRNAFILAPIKEEDEDDDATYALYPPKVFQLAKVEYSLRLWRVDRALYGFRRSPRLWGKFRDRRLRAAKIAYGNGYIYLRQHKADENIWSAVVVGPDGKEEIQAYVNVYVDDILYVGREGIIEAIHSWLTEEWKAKGYSIPCPQEWLLGENDALEEQYEEPQLRKAQALTGLRALGYLKETIDLELYYTPQQALVALSVAEAELIEAISAAQMSYGIIAVTSELQSAYRLSTYPGSINLATWGRKRSIVLAYRPSGNLAKVNGTIAILARLAVVLGWLVQASRASPTEGDVGLQVSFPWELYGLAAVALVAAIGVWEALKWCLEWISLKQSGSVQDARQVRRLRRLQQAVSEEVARYGLDDLGVATQAPSTPLASVRTTPRPSPVRSIPEVRAVQTATAAVQTDFDDGY
ncbi:unnamed protein product, partial [Symbiodinium necroappetens]